LRAIPVPPLRFTFQPRREAERQRSLPEARALAVGRLAAALFEQYADPDVSEPPQALAQRGASWYEKAVVPVIAALLGAGSPRVLVNTRNRDALAGLGAEAIVETWAEVRGDAVEPEPAGPLPDGIRGLVFAAEAYAQLAATAALEPSERHVLAALLANPLVRDYELAAAMAPLVMEGVGGAGS